MGDKSNLIAIHALERRVRVLRQREIDTVARLQAEIAICEAQLRLLRVPPEPDA